MLFDSLIFDLDGTLVDSADLVGHILNEMRSEYGLPALPSAFYRLWSSRGGSQLVGRALEIDPSEAAAHVDEFRRRYRERPTPRESVYPGAHTLLAACRDAGRGLAICSNKPEHLCRKVLAETGLDIYFQTIIGGDTTAHGKPHPAPLIRAMADLNARPERSVMIGDSSVDQKTAANLGVPFVLFTGGYDDGVDRQATAATIDLLPELLTWLAADRQFFAGAAE